jgi:hypothetical protein
MKVDKGTKALLKVNDRLKKMSPEEFKKIHDKAVANKRDIVVNPEDVKQLKVRLREQALDQLTQTSEVLHLYDFDSYPVYKDPRKTRPPENRPSPKPDDKPVDESISNNVTIDNTQETTNENNITNDININISFDGLGELFKRLDALESRDHGDTINIYNQSNQFNYGFGRRHWNPIPLFNEQLFGYQYSQLWGTRGVEYPLGFQVPRFI